MTSPSAAFSLPVAIALVLGVLLGRFSAGAFPIAPPPAPAMAMDHGSMEGMDMSGAMHDMNAALEGKSGDALDRAFVTEMIMHHQGAVEMAQAVLDRGMRKEVKDLAAAIIKAQTKEIDMMRAWQAAWDK